VIALDQCFCFWAWWSNQNLGTFCSIHGPFSLSESRYTASKIMPK
jgi:hypothetical protein